VVEIEILLNCGFIFGFSLTVPLYALRGSEELRQRKGPGVSSFVVVLSQVKSDTFATFTCSFSTSQNVEMSSSIRVSNTW